MANAKELTPIEDGASYPLDDFRRRTGQGYHAMMKARQNGLKVRRQGSRTFILGRDWNEYLASLPVDGECSA